MQLNTERSPRLLCVKIPTVYKKQQPRDRRLCHLLWERLGKRAAGQHGSVRDSRERGQSRSPGSSGQTALRYRRRAPRDAGGRCRQTLVSRLHPELNQLQSFGARAGLLQICTGKLDQKSPFLCILTNSRRSVQTKTPPARAGPSRGRLFAGSAWSPLLVNWITTGSAANSPCSECLSHRWTLRRRLKGGVIEDAQDGKCPPRHLCAVFWKVTAPSPAASPRVSDQGARSELSRARSPASLGSSSGFRGWNYNANKH